MVLKRALHSCTAWVILRFQVLLGTPKTHSFLPNLPSYWVAPGSRLAPYLPWSHQDLIPDPTRITIWEAWEFDCARSCGRHLCYNILVVHRRLQSTDLWNRSWEKPKVNNFFPNVPSSRLARSSAEAWSHPDLNCAVKSRWYWLTDSVWMLRGSRMVLPAVYRGCIVLCRYKL